MRRAVVDRAVGLTLVAIAVIWCWIALTTIPPTGLEGSPGPRLFPVLLGALLGVLGLVLALSSVIGRVPAPAEEAPASDRVKRDEVAIVAGGIGVFILYAFLMDKIGFLLATPIVVALALWGILGVRAWLSIALMAIGLTLGCYLVFGVAMQANLPQGRWIIDTEE